MPLHLFSTTLKFFPCVVSHLSSFLVNHDLWYKYSASSLLQYLPVFTWPHLFCRLFCSFLWLTLEKHYVTYITCFFSNHVCSIPHRLNSECFSFIFLVFCTLLWVHLHSSVQYRPSQDSAPGHGSDPSPLVSCFITLLVIFVASNITGAKIPRFC